AARMCPAQKLLGQTLSSPTSVSLRAFLCYCACVSPARALPRLDGQTAASVLCPAVYAEHFGDVTAGVAIRQIREVTGLLARDEGRVHLAVAQRGLVEARTEISIVIGLEVVGVLLAHGPVVLPADDVRGQREQG